MIGNIFFYEVKPLQAVCVMNYSHNTKSGVLFYSSRSVFNSSHPFSKSRGEGFGVFSKKTDAKTLLEKPSVFIRLGKDCAAIHGYC